MPLEVWGERKKKYILYRNEAEHHEDCLRFPFNEIPTRVFLDTNVINLLVKYPSEIFEQQFLEKRADQTLAEDVEALMHVFHIGVRANWQLFASAKTMEELENTKRQDVRDRLVGYAIELMDYSGHSGDHRFADDFGRKLVDTHFVAALPDNADRELIGNAIGLNCDAFCTCDRSTIVRHRDRLRQIPLRILTPSEWWARIRPWAGLFV